MPDCILIRADALGFSEGANFCVDGPITNPMPIPSICQENGEFKSSREYRDAFKEKRKAVAGRK